MAETLKLNERAGRSKRKTSGGIWFIVDEFCKKNF
jgi:hypothetical protein